MKVNGSFVFRSKVFPKHLFYLIECDYTFLLSRGKWETISHDRSENVWTNLSYSLFSISSFFNKPENLRLGINSSKSLSGMLFLQFLCPETTVNLVWLEAFRNNTYKLQCLVDHQALKMVQVETKRSCETTVTVV